MANSAEVRRPSVTVEGEATDSLSISWTVPLNVAGSPCAKYSTHASGGDDVVSPTAEELITKLSDAQSSMFSSPEEKSIEIDDGVAALTFKGYDTGPHHEVLFGGVNNGRTVVHRCSKLDFINTSIYVGQRGTSMYKGVIDTSAGSVTNWLRVVLENIIERWEASKDDNYNELDAKSKAVRDAIHATNISIINDEWYPVLDASADIDLKGFDTFTSKRTLRMHLAGVIGSVYVSNGGSSFFSKMAQFENMFQMRFIPDAEGDTCGKFISVKSVVNDAEDKNVSIKGLSIRAGPRSFLPVTAVAVTGVPTPEMHKGSNKVRGTSLISWPETIPATGSVLTVPAPPWIPSEILPRRQDLRGKTLDPGKVKGKLEEDDSDIKTVHEAIVELVTDYANCVYDDVSLGTSTATINTLLDVTWEVGKRYAVTQDEGGKLFDGFLQNMEHRISSNPERPDAVTMLTFSHVEANGFTLPNK